MPGSPINTQTASTNQATGATDSQDQSVATPSQNGAQADNSSQTTNPSVGGSGSSPVNATGGDPLDLVTGGYIYRHQDFAVGSGSFPTALALSRTYDSGMGQIGQNTSLLGNGWMHNYDITALPDSDGFEGMGQNSPISGAPAIAAIYVIQDIVNLQTSTAVPVDRVIVAAMAARWLMDQLTNNVIAITRAGSVERFILLPSGAGPNVYNAPFGSTSVLTANANGGYTYTTKTREALAFNPPSGTAPGKVTQWASPNGASVSFAYNSNGQLQSVTNPNSQQQLNFNYNASKQLASVSDGAGRSVSYAYDGQGNLQSFTDPLQYKTAYTYGAIGQLTQIFYPTNPSGSFVSMVYDTLGRPSQQADALGHVTNLYFAGTRTETDDPAGTAHVSYFSTRGKLLAQIEGLGSASINAGAGNKTTTAYDGLDRPILLTLPEGGTTAYTYATAVNPWANNVASITRTAKPGSTLLPLTTSFSYDPFYNKPISVTDPLLHVSTLAYDGAGNLAQIVADAGAAPHLNATTRYAYNGVGQVVSVTDPVGTNSVFGYDQHGNQVSAIRDYGPHRLNQLTKVAYDAVGNATAVTDPNGNVTGSAYDANRRLTSTTSPATSAAPNGLMTSLTYDQIGELLQTQQSASGTILRTTSATYTLTGKRATSTDANGNVTRYGYDGADRLASITDAMGRLTTYGYDALSRRISVSNPAIQAAPLLQQSYSPDGLVGTLTDANSNVTSFAFDGFDRLSTTTYPTGGGTEGLTYDADSNVLTRTTRANQTITFTYDTLNRLATKAAPSEPTVTYGYDLAGRTTSVSDNSLPITLPPPAVFTTNFTYDALNRPTNVTWNPALAPAPPPTSSVTFTYTYNKANQRSTQTPSDPSWWSYPTTASTVSYAANNLNQYTDVGSLNNIPYDGNGNLTSDGTFTYCYDAENRLTSVLSGGTCASPDTQVATYAYDGQGRRKLKSNLVGSPTTTIFVTDADNREVLEYGGASFAILNWYAYGLDPNAVLNQMGVAAGTRTTLRPDIQGSIIGTLDAASGTLTKIAYGVYGEGVTGGSFRYTGQRIDPESNGLYYYRARHYMPAWGRFMQVDPIGYTKGSNLFAYVGNDPLNNVDPSGLTPDNPQASQGWLGSALSWLQNTAIGAADLYGQGQLTTMQAQTQFAQEHPGYTALGAAAPLVGGAIIFGPEVIGGGALVGAGTTVGGGTGAAVGGRLALGLGETLDEFAASQGANTWKSFADPLNWKVEMTEQLANPNIAKVFNLEGVDVLGGVARAAAGRGGATDWELLQIRSNPQWWNSIQWFKGGQPAGNPFAP